MEEDFGAVFYPAIVEKSTSEHRCVKLRFRGRRNHLLDPKHKSYELQIVWISDDEAVKKSFVAAQHLRPGDEIYVEVDHSEWSNPKRCNIFRRCWNLLFG